MLDEGFKFTRFNSRDGAIDRILLPFHFQGLRCFNSRDGAIDRWCISKHTEPYYSVSIPEMVRLIVSTVQVPSVTSVVSIPEMVRLIVDTMLDEGFKFTRFNSRDGAIDSGAQSHRKYYYKNVSIPEMVRLIGPRIPGYGNAWDWFQFQRWCDW